MRHTRGKHILRKEVIPVCLRAGRDAAQCANVHIAENDISSTLMFWALGSSQKFAISG